MLDRKEGRDKQILSQLYEIINEANAHVWQERKFNKAAFHIGRMKLLLEEHLNGPVDRKKKRALPEIDIEEQDPKQ